MVSTHRVPVVVYLTIRVLCFIFRFKRGNYCSYHAEALDCLPIVTNNSPRRTVYSTPH